MPSTVLVGHLTAGGRGLWKPASYLNTPSLICGSDVRCQSQVFPAEVVCVCFLWAASAAAAPVAVACNSTGFDSSINWSAPLARSAGCLGTAGCGLQFDVRLLEPLAAATFSYHFRFSDGYEWTRGGKMPGICSEGAPACLFLSFDLYARENVRSTMWGR